MTKRRNIHDRVMSAGTIDELAEVYAEWADNYDKDLQIEMGYQAPTAVARLLRDNLQPSNAKILDAGCGTGLSGVALAELGYESIDGLDYSAEMLIKAKNKAVYASLSKCNLMKPLEISDNTYDAVTCVGTFTLAHVGPKALDELIRVTRKGGYICFTVRNEAWVQDKYHSAISDLTLQNSWEKLAVEEVTYIDEEGSMCRLCLFKVC